MPILLREMLLDVADIMRDTIEDLIWNCTPEVDGLMLDVFEADDRLL